MTCAYRIAKDSAMHTVEYHPYACRKKTTRNIHIDGAADSYLWLRHVQSQNVLVFGQRMHSIRVFPRFLLCITFAKSINCRTQKYSFWVLMRIMTYMRICYWVETCPNGSHLERELQSLMEFEKWWFILWILLNMNSMCIYGSYHAIRQTAFGVSCHWRLATPDASQLPAIAFLAPYSCIVVNSQCTSAHPSYSVTHANSE